MRRLQDRVAIVTGAGRGIGRAIAVQLAEDGADVVAGDLDADKADETVELVRKTGRQGCAVVGDSTEADIAQLLAETALDHFGRVDILVNNVGGGQPGRIWELSEETWDRVIRVNLRSMFLCTRAVVPHMMEQGYGRIVSISSGAREGTPWQAYYVGAAPYSTAKAGVHGFTREVSLELAEHGINVNAVAPGPIETDRVIERLRQGERAEYSAIKMTPLRRYGQPSEIADAVAFLASDEASYITGQTLSVAGGR